MQNIASLNFDETNRKKQEQILLNLLPESDLIAYFEVDHTFDL